MKIARQGVVAAPQRSSRGRGNLAPTPLQLGYRMPAEWEPHEATWLAWPHNEETWPGKVKEVEEIYVQMIEVLTAGEKACLLVNDERTKERVAKILATWPKLASQVFYYEVPTVDSWIRDYGPNFIAPHPNPLPRGGRGEPACPCPSLPGRQAGGRRGSGRGEGGDKDKPKVAIVRWRFNAWGGKYPELAKDNRIPEDLAPHLEIPVFSPGLILEGGSIDTNGLGTVLTTGPCLLNPNRNPHLAREGIEKALEDYLGFTHVIWLGEGIEGDDTDGHIDNITRFVNPTTVVTAVEDNAADFNHGPLQANLNRLKQARNQDGKKLDILTLPMPDRVEGPWGRLPASYLNFYIGNAALLVPIFGKRQDKEALRILAEVFPGRRVVGIRSETLVLGLGGIHCVTHEQPAAA